MSAVWWRLGMPSLSPTTPYVAPSEAGKRLLCSIASLFDQIATEVESLGEWRDKHAGTIRSTCTDDQIELCLRPMLAGFLKDYTEITLEFYVYYVFPNVVS